MPVELCCVQLITVAAELMELCCVQLITIAAELMKLYAVDNHSCRTDGIVCS